MGGGLMQLVAYGSQDVFLTGNPEITYWKLVVKRHSNFATECIRQTFNGSGLHKSCTISRNGDLISGGCLVFKRKAGNTGRSLIYDLVDKIELEIGGQKIDVQDGEWMKVWKELSTTKSHYTGFTEMVNGVSGVSVN